MEIFIGLTMMTAKEACSADKSHQEGDLSTARTVLMQSKAKENRA
jgi:hypothetical protein